MANNTLLWILGIAIVGYFVWTKVVIPNATRNIGIISTELGKHPKLQQNLTRDIHQFADVLEHPSTSQVHYAYYD